jgi:hypothetical protein
VNQSRGIPVMARNVIRVTGIGLLSSLVRGARTRLADDG